MDQKTLEYYQQNSDEICKRYNSVSTEKFLGKYFKNIFPEKNKEKYRILDYGCGSGRDVLYLINQGYDAYGYDISSEMILSSKKINPILKDRLFDSISSLKESEKYNSVICSAVLQHVTDSEILEVLKTIKYFLKENGNLVISYPVIYANLDNENRDDKGRLQIIRNSEFYISKLVSLGFTHEKEWFDKDSMNREGISWQTSLFTL
ncbi:MAG: class I SAM-dependent methyltransferase [Spirochaetia bacterium]|nr:class I SAM-dependent methyltransferase [Spirochaetia bacterium]